MIGQKFGKWTVIDKIKRPEKRGYGYWCACKCGIEKLLYKHNLTSGDSKQCKECRFKEIAIDYSGQRFNKWLVLDKASKKSAYGACYYKARCDCGLEKIVNVHDLVRGKSKNCLKCYKRDGENNSCYRHGMHAVKEYRVWCGMRQRCSNPKSKCYKWYGGKGIQVCERWQNSFASFYEDMGPRPSDKHEIDRIDSNRNYEKENCRWVTHKENLDNQRKWGNFAGKTNNQTR